MSRSRDRKRKFGELLERARRGEDLKLRFDKTGNNVNDATIFANLEGLFEDWEAGRPLDEVGRDFLMDVLRELVVLAVRSGRTGKSPEVRKEQDAAIRQGRQHMKDLKKREGYTTEEALSRTVTYLKKKYPGLFVSWKKGVPEDWADSTFKDHLTRRPHRS
jgi:hypothetical protein